MARSAWWTPARCSPPTRRAFSREALDNGLRAFAMAWFLQSSGGRGGRVRTIWIRTGSTEGMRRKKPNRRNVAHPSDNLLSRPWGSREMPLTFEFCPSERQMGMHEMHLISGIFVGSGQAAADRFGVTPTCRQGDDTNPLRGGVAIHIGPASCAGSLEAALPRSHII